MTGDMKRNGAQNDTGVLGAKETRVDRDGVTIFVEIGNGNGSESIGNGSGSDSVQSGSASGSGGQMDVDERREMKCDIKQYDDKLNEKLLIVQDNSNRKENGKVVENEEKQEKDVVKEEKEVSKMKVVERRESNMEDESVDTNRNEKAVENYVEDKIENYFENNEVDYVGRLAPTPSGYMHGTLR